MLRSSLSIWLTLIAAAAAQSATPSNVTYMQPSIKNHTVVLALDEGGNSWQPFLLNPLTSGALSRLPAGANSAAGDTGYMHLIGPNTANNLSLNDIATISCDSSVYSAGNIGLSTLISHAISANVTAIIFYALDSTTCNITGNYGDFDALYTMTSIGDSTDLHTHLADALNNGYGVLEAIILTKVAFNNLYYSGPDSPAPGTAVAMIILYSITGLITALFLSIIVTGAIRAHRHPERYGRRDFLGRPTQSRARGLARAILDTLPIVKFGEKPDDKEAGTELAATSEATHTNTNDTTLPRPSTSHDSPTSSGAQETTTTTTSDTITGLATASPSSPTKHETKTTTTTTTTADTADTSTSPLPNNEDSALGCSICTDDFEPGQDLRVLPCSHKFHPACVDPWLLDVSGTCPLCRVDLRPARTNSTSGANGENNGEEGGELAPPLRDPAGGSRRRRLGGFFAELRRVQMATPQERIAALRNLRNEGRRAEVRRSMLNGR